MHGIPNTHQCMTYNSTHTVCVGHEYIYGTTDVASNVSVMVISTPRGNAAPLNDLISPAIGLEATFFLMSLSSVLMLITVVGSDAYTARADEQIKTHEALLKILSQLQSPSGHEEAKNQNTPVQEAPAAGDDGEMSPSNDGGSVVPAEAETEWISLAEEDKLGTLPP